MGNFTGGSRAVREFPNAGTRAVEHPNHVLVGGNEDCFPIERTRWLRPRCAVRLDESPASTEPNNPGHEAPKSLRERCAASRVCEARRAL